MTEFFRGRFFGYEIQHIFPEQILRRLTEQARIADDFLNSIDFDIQARGNKIPLLSGELVRNAILAAPQAIQDIFTNAGFGFNRHDSQASGGNHPGYNAFIIGVLNDFAADAAEFGWDTLTRSRAVFDLHQFVALANKNGFPPLIGSDSMTFAALWNDYRTEFHGNANPDYQNLSDDARVNVDQYGGLGNVNQGTFNPDPIDGMGRNSQLRYETTELLLNSARGQLDPEQIANAEQTFNAAGADGSSSTFATAAAISLVVNLQRQSTNPATENTRAIAEILAADAVRFTVDEKGVFRPEAALAFGALGLSKASDVFGFLFSTLDTLFTTVGQYADSFADTLSDFGDSVIGEIVKSADSLLVGIGGSIVGDAVEFLNSAYDAIKVGFQTGNWVPLGVAVAQFGAGAILSAFLVTGSIVAVTGILTAVGAGALAPAAAAFVAAGWAAYGLYDAVINGAELFDKITADLADAFTNLGNFLDDLGDSFQESISLIVRIIDAAFNSDFEIPVFNGVNENLFLADTFDLSLPASVTGSDEDEIFYGTNNAFVDAGAGNDEIYAIRSSGEFLGGEGDDVLVGNNPQVVFEGEYINLEDRENIRQDETLPREDREGIVDLVADKTLRLTLDGGKGDDWIIVGAGGTGAITVGGEGRDFIFNTSFSGQIYGDTLDGLDADGNELNHEGLENSDVFWFWPGTFIQDAQPNDILQIFGLPLVGGSNSIAGIPAGDGGLAIDFFNWTTFYGTSNSGQLLVYNAIADLILNGANNSLGSIFGDGSGDILQSVQVVENYRFGGFSNEQFGRVAPGDLGLTFRIFLPRDRADEGITISLFNAAWGSVFTYIDVAFNLAKLIRWQPVDDPLILDLDGDGIETVSQSQSGVHFDLDGDFFAESTGWVSSDDGFLALDKNGNGRIDDITELFGAPGVSGFEELAEYDSNSDGIINLNDDVFEDLRVWRDLDQDGYTDDGELFTLAEVDILSINIGGEELGTDDEPFQTPQGTTLTERGTFTRTDGSTNNIFNAVFETNNSDTIYRGETRGDEGRSAERDMRTRGDESGTPERLFFSCLVWMRSPSVAAYRDRATGTTYKVVRRARGSLLPCAEQAAPPLLYGRAA